MSDIPELTRDGLDNYVQHRIPPGGFLRAVLENNLREAFARADKHNRVAMFDIVCYCHWEIPGDCGGSPERVKAWLSTPRAGDEPEPVVGLETQPEGSGSEVGS